MTLAGDSAGDHGSGTPLGCLALQPSADMPLSPVPDRQAPIAHQGEWHCV